MDSIQDWWARVRKSANHRQEEKHASMRHDHSYDQALKALVSLGMQGPVISGKWQILSTGGTPCVACAKVEGTRWSSEAHYNEFRTLWPCVDKACRLALSKL